jgi:Rha family phage regulatory protein
VTALENGKVMTTSLKVAEVFGKRHYVVLRAIAALDCSEQFIADNFIASEYTDATGRSLLNPLTLCAPLTRMKTDDQITSHNMRGNPMTTSLKMAEVFGKEHYDVIKAIEALDCSKEFRDGNFTVSSYSVPNNRRPYPMYLMTRDGFTFLAMGFTIPVFPFLLPLNPANPAEDSTQKAAS